jgi:hypothetical protein
MIGAVPALLALAFLVTALLYASVGFGGGSTYSALLALSGLDYRLLPLVALACNIAVVSGSSIRFARAGITPWKKAFVIVALGAPASFVGGLTPIKEATFLTLLGASLVLTALTMLIPVRENADGGPTGFARWMPLAAAPLAAEEVSPEQAEVTAAAKAFIFAIGNPNRSVLADHMLPEGMIFVHNRMDPANPRVDVVPVRQHLDRWLGQRNRIIEEMDYTTVLVDGDMAQVWGPYAFAVNSVVTHCGINSLSMVRTESGWKVANTSFTMEPPGECKRLGAPGFGQ